MSLKDDSCIQRWMLVQNLKPVAVAITQHCEVVYVTDSYISNTGEEEIFPLTSGGV